MATITAVARSSASIARRPFSTCTPSSPHLSTYHRGTAFEERSMKILQDHLSMSLKRVGGKEDGGIDLLGWWWLPEIDSVQNDTGQPQRRRVRVLGQCKAEKKKMGPKYVREMEGVLHRYLSISNTFGSSHRDMLPHLNEPHTSQYPLVALVISESQFTKSTLVRAQSSPVPFFLLHIPPAAEMSDPSADLEQDRYRLGSAVWNPALSGVNGLLKGQMETRWEHSVTGGGRPGLWWNNRKLKSWTPNITPDGLSLSDEDAFLKNLTQE